MTLVIPFAEGETTLDWIGLTEALEAAFPVVRKLVGDEFFRAMAGVYLRTHPPKTPLMMFYGEAMPQFLSRFGPTKKFGYLPDIAIGQAVSVSVDALPGELLAGELAAVDPARAWRQVWQDVLAGILRHVSVGYSVEEWAETTETGARVLTAVRWTE